MFKELSIEAHVSTQQHHSWYQIYKQKFRIALYHDVLTGQEYVPIERKTPSLRLSEAMNSPDQWDSRPLNVDRSVTRSGAESKTDYGGTGRALVSSEHTYPFRIP